MSNPYVQVLRTPHAVPMVLVAFIGRLPLSMVGLGSVMLPPGPAPAAFTWIGTALGLGVAVGASAAGKVVDLVGANASFLVATAAAVIAAAVVGVCQGVLRVPVEHAGSPALAR